MKNYKVTLNGEAVTLPNWKSAEGIASLLHHLENAMNCREGVECIYDLLPKRERRSLICSVLLDNGEWVCVRKLKITLK